MMIAKNYSARPAPPRRLVVGIDPDVEKSGVAVIKPDGSISIHTLSFPELLDKAQELAREAKRRHCPLTFIVEAGWLNTSHWHLRHGDTKAICALKGNSVGRNHETGRKLVECLRHYGLDVIEQRPLLKRWGGKDGKITHREATAYIPAFRERTSNQEERDALLLAYVWGGGVLRNQNKAI